MTMHDAIDPRSGAPDYTGFTPREEEDEVARQLLRPCFASDGERLLLLGFDAFERLTGLECIDNGARSHCCIAPAHWRRLIERPTAYVLLAHNHPSGMARPSRADIACTRDAANFLAAAGLDLIDHLIFTADGHFSFRRAGLI